MAKVKKINDIDIDKKRSAKLLYIFLITLFISIANSLFKNHYLEFILKIVAFVIFFISIKLIDKGLEVEEKFNKEKLALAPKIKYKLIAATLLGIDIFFINFFINHTNLINSISLSILTLFGILLYYGIDPIKNKIPQNTNLNIDKILEELKEAKIKIDKIKGIQKNIKDLELKNAIDKATNKAEYILETIKEDPKDIKVVRKFILIYLDGIKNVIDKYNEIDKTKLDNSFRIRLIELLNLATKKFDKELDKLKSNDIFDLDVQIDALKEQLKH